MKDLMPTIRLHARGFIHMKGNSKGNGKAYDFAQLMVEIPFKPAQSTNMHRMAFGQEAVSFEVESSFASKFYGFPYPCDLDVQIEEELVKGRNGSLETRKKAVNAVIAQPVAKAA